jgi:hypothetical protein
MRPDARLAGVLGLTRVSGTVDEGYVQVSGSTAAGAGITTDTMQYHGTSDRYTLSGAAQVADLYTNATTAAGNPAVTLRSVGSAGGQAAAFSYDLPARRSTCGRATRPGPERKETTTRTT